MAADDRFDPYTLLATLERHLVAYVVIGALGRVLQGSGEITNGVDICPSTHPESMRRLGLALTDLNARRPNGKPVVLERDLVGRPLLELGTDAGELKIVPEPPAATTTSAAEPDTSRSDKDSDPRSPRSTTTPACSPSSPATRTANPCAPCSG